MAFSIANVEPLAAEVSVTEHELVLMLVDGRQISVPLVWFPRLLRASSVQRNEFELIGDGEGIHWPAVDEYINVRGLVLGYPSAEYRKGAQYLVPADPSPRLVRPRAAELGPARLALRVIESMAGLRHTFFVDASYDFDRRIVGSSPARANGGP